MTKRLVRVVIDVELENDVVDLVSKVAARAHTIQGVANAWDGWVEDITHIGERTVHAIQEQTTVIDDGLPYTWRPFRAFMEWVHKVLPK